MPRFKRPIEDLANKSDSDDDDYSDHPVRAPPRPRSKKKAKPAKKKARRTSDDDLSDEDLFDEADELSYQESDEEEDDQNAQRNARGLVARRAATKRPTYNEDETSSIEDDPDEDADGDSEPIPSSPRKRKSAVVTLKVGDALKRQPPEDHQLAHRRITRRTRGASEDIYALTNSGRHMETVERATLSPDADADMPRRGRRGSRASKRTPGFAAKPDDLDVIDETTMEIKGSQPEIMESDVPVSFDESLTAAAPPTTQGDPSVVPESENGDAKNGVGGAEDDDEDDEDEGPVARRRTRRGRSQPTEDPDEEDAGAPRRSSRKKPRSSQRQNDEGSDFEPEEEESNDEDEDELSQPGKSQASPRKGSQMLDEDEADSTAGRRPGLRKRASRSRGHSEAAGDIAEELAEELHDLRGGRPRRRVQTDIVYEKPRRTRKDVDYRIIRPDLILPIEEAENEVNESPSRRGGGRGGGGGGGGAWQRSLFPTFGPFGGGGPSAILGPPGAPATIGGADSDSSDDEATPQARGSASGPALPGAGLLPAQTNTTEAAPGLSGTPANLGKLKDRQTLADADPLGVDTTVNFDSVGGLQGHIDQLKEMVSLPLLYPEIFQRFHIVPPRGVLFHGPPGTGKTLLARALANSVSSEGRKVTFYMRKGADALSKWVGEAERQLRLLFDEARKTQPSIIFFDEIDGMFSLSLFFFFLRGANCSSWVKMKIKLTRDRSRPRAFQQAGADPRLDRVDLTGADGRHGWPRTGDRHRRDQPARFHRPGPPPARQI